MIKDRLEVIFRQSFEIEKFTEDLSIDNVTGWDSMAHVGLILALQKEFAISIPPVDAIELTGVKNIIQYLRARTFRSRQKMEPNNYAKLLAEQGNYVINIEGVDWYHYSGFMMPAYLPHCVPAISEEIARKTLAESGRPFVRWDAQFGQIQNSEWWYILRKGSWSIDDVKDKKKRWMIRQGKKGFTVRPLTPEEAVKLCPQVALAATARYKGKAEIETREIMEKKVEASQKVPGVLEYLGCFQGDKLASFSENYIQDNAVWLAIIRHDPDFLKGYSSYGFMDGILDYYLNGKKFLYVLDGSRSIHHKTNFQDYLTEIFGFTKEYARLNAVYSAMFATIVKMVYPFRGVLSRISEKTNNRFIANINAVLKQEYIRKSCQ